MTIIEGDSGWIIVDPLTAKETADKALKLAQQHLGKRTIKAVIYTHSHLEHFGGIEGVLVNMSAADQKALRIIAPEGFMEEATSENIIAGMAMGWRDAYLTGAYELRNGAAEKSIDMAIMEGVLLKTPVANFLDSMSVRLNGPKAAGKKIDIKVTC